MKIVVSMTSYPKRIVNVGKSIYALLNKQTLPPDEIYIWLSTEEFPNKENDLPKDLVLFSEVSNKIKIKWVEKNTYVHKRHEIFKIIKDAYVFFMDDDVYYNEDLIKTVVEKAKQYPNSIICYNNYNPHEYHGKHILYRNNTFGSGPFINKIRWCGQSMIPSEIYPMEILSDEYKKIRDKTSPISDECWFQPFVVEYNLPIYYCNFGWGIDISPTLGKQSGLVSWSHQLDANGLEKRDNWLNAVLNAFPNILKKYERLFNYGK